MSLLPVRWPPNRSVAAESLRPTEYGADEAERSCAEKAQDVEVVAPGQDESVAQFERAAHREHNLDAAEAEHVGAFGEDDLGAFGGNMVYDDVETDRRLLEAREDRADPAGAPQVGSDVLCHEMSGP